jgi:hypothetical protein
MRMHISQEFASVHVPIAPLNLKKGKSYNISVEINSDKVDMMIDSLNRIIMHLTPVHVYLQ